MPPALPNSKVSHLRYIDALRGIAFLGVLAVHGTQQVPAFRGVGLAATGQYGVQLFFLMSAVTLLRSFAVRGTGEANPLRNYFLRRFFRIAPLFWFGIVLYYFVLGNGPSPWAPEGVHLWQYAATATFTHGWLPTSINSVVPGGWSIAVEMTFFAALWLVRRFLPADWFLGLPHFGPEMLYLATILCGLGLTVVFSVVTYRLIEQPGIGLGKRLIRRGEARRARETAKDLASQPQRASV